MLVEPALLFAPLLCGTVVATAAAGVLAADTDCVVGVACPCGAGVSADESENVGIARGVAMPAVE